MYPARGAAPRRDEQGDAGAGTYLWSPAPGLRRPPGAGLPPARMRRGLPALPSHTSAAAGSARGPAQSPCAARPAPLGTGTVRTTPGCPRHLQDRERGTGPRRGGPGSGGGAQGHGREVAACYCGWSPGAFEAIVAALSRFQGGTFPVIQTHHDTERQSELIAEATGDRTPPGARCSPAQFPTVGTASVSGLGAMRLREEVTCNALRRAGV